jgi:hypothetical protein
VHNLVCGKMLYLVMQTQPSSRITAAVTAIVHACLITGLKKPPTCLE